METTFFHSPLFELLMRFGIDIIAMALLTFGLYYRRYHDKELTTVAALFNIFVFAVLTILSSVEFSIAAGFGLFAILALFTLRSEPITKIEISYFFGSIAIAVICSVKGTTLPLVSGTVVCLLIGAYVVDHPQLLHSVSGVKVTLDRIDSHALSDPQTMRTDLSRRLNVAVMDYQIISFDYVNETARLNVFFRTATANENDLTAAARNTTPAAPAHSGTATTPADAAPQERSS